MLSNKAINSSSLLKSIVKHSFGAIHKASADHTFIAANTDKKTLVFDGLQGKDNATFALDNIYRHHNDLGLLQ